MNIFRGISLDDSMLLLQFADLRDGKNAGW